MSNNTITVLAEESRNLDTVCYRGTAALKDLTRVSQVDVFDQVRNPQGLQRDLSKAHALAAYNYVAKPADEQRPRAFPEVMLNVRDKAVVDVRDVNIVNADGLDVTEDLNVGALKVVAITFDLDKIDRAKTVKVSRVDGNHRLFFGNGDGKDREPLDASVPFSLTLGLTREQEGSIFLDVNAEQKGLNTSHLHVLRGRLTPDEVELELHPERVYALRLAQDEASPWCELVHLGGSRRGSKEAHIVRPVTFVALEQGVRRTLRKSPYLQEVTTHDARYALIRNYWQAVKQVFPEAWEHPAEYLILKNLGVSTFSQLGGTIIDRSMAKQAIEVEDMVAMLTAVKDTVDWHKESTDVAGMSGNRAVLALSGRMAEALPALS